MTLFVYSFSPLCLFFCATFLPSKTFDIYWYLAFCSFTIPAWSLSGSTTGIEYVILIFALLCGKNDIIVFDVWSLWKFIYIRVLKGILLGRHVLTLEFSYFWFPVHIYPLMQRGTWLFFGCFCTSAICKSFLSFLCFS